MKLSDIDLNRLDVFEKATPHDQFALLRREAPVHRHEAPPGEQDYWCITKHQDVKAISKNPQLFSSERMSAILRDPDPESLPMLRLIMLNMDPPKHRQYRAIVNKAFTPRMVQGLEASVDRMVTEIIDEVIEKGECDFVDSLAAPLPMKVICEMMGVPEEDRRAIYDLSNKMIGFDDPEYGEVTGKFGEDDGHQASAEMFMYAGKLAERARSHPANDLATALLNAEVDGEKLSEMEFNSFFLLLSVAGNETTRTVTTNGMLDLIRHPEQRQKVLDDPSLLNSAVEEVLRHEPAVHAFRRTATADTEIRGVPIAEGDKLIMWYPSVNRDEDVFDRPADFDVTRSPNDHLSFGVGEHFCLGANLARMELRKIFGGLLSRLPDIELAAEPRRLRSNFINGVKEMQVEFTPGRKSTG
jgi:cholest-4-en-3-one 26-monooxygenase